MVSDRSGALRHIPHEAWAQNVQDQALLEAFAQNVQDQAFLEALTQNVQDQAILEALAQGTFNQNFEIFTQNEHLPDQRFFS